MSRRSSVPVTRHLIRTPRPEVHASHSRESSCPIVSNSSGSSAECGGVLSDSERERLRATTQFRASCSRISPTFQNGVEKNGREEPKEEQPSLSKKSRYDHGQPRETSWQKQKTRNIEPRQLRAISSTAEIIKEQNKQRSLRSMYFPFQRKADWEQLSADVERSLTNCQPYKKGTLKLQLREAAKSFNHSYNFESPNKVDEASVMAHQKIRFFGL